MKKGYLKKVQSKDDKREYHLQATEKYINYYNISYGYIQVVMDRIRERFDKEELETLDRVLEIIDKELMPEINIDCNKKM